MAEWQGLYSGTDRAQHFVDRPESTPLTFIHICSCFRLLCDLHSYALLMPPQIAEATAMLPCGDRLFN